MRVAATVAGALLVVAGCGPVGAPASPVPAQSATPIPKKVKIVSSLPLQGPQRVGAIPVVNGIRMALEEHGGRAGTTIVEYESYDSASAARQAWDGRVEEQNARRAAADRSVVAYIGTYNSPAARISIPITCEAGLFMISPANTYPGLTKPQAKDEPGKYYPACARNYARVIPTDDVQGAAAARWAKELGARRVYVVDDGTLYGTVTSGGFRAEAKRLGLEEVGYDSAPKASELPALSTAIARSTADLLYDAVQVVDGTYDPGPLIRAVRQVRPAITVMAPDGVSSNEFLSRGGPSVMGTYFTTEVVPVAGYVGKMRDWAMKYTARYGEPPGPYAIYGYEVARVVLAAITKAGARADDRATIRDLALGTRDFDGVSGTWSLDANGDTTLTMVGGFRLTKTVAADIDGALEFQKALR